MDRCVTDVHISVLSEEVLEYLRAERGKVYVDGTLGLGGHTQHIIQASEPENPGEVLAQRGKGVLTQTVFTARASKIPADMRLETLRNGTRLRDLINTLLLRAQLAADAREADFDKEQVIINRMYLAAETELVRVSPRAGGIHEERDLDPGGRANPLRGVQRKTAVVHRDRTRRTRREGRAGALGGRARGDPPRRHGERLADQR